MEKLSKEKFHEFSKKAEELIKKIVDLENEGNVLVVRLLKNNGPEEDIQKLETITDGINKTTGELEALTLQVKQLIGIVPKPELLN